MRRIKVSNIEIETRGGIEEGARYGPEGYATVNGIEIRWGYDWTTKGWKFWAENIEGDPFNKKALPVIKKAIDKEIR